MRHRACCGVALVLTKAESKSQSVRMARVRVRSHFSHSSTGHAGRVAERCRVYLSVQRYTHLCTFTCTTVRHSKGYGFLVKLSLRLVLGVSQCERNHDDSQVILKHLTL